MKLLPIWTRSCNLSLIAGNGYCGDLTKACMSSLPWSSHCASAGCPRDNSHRLSTAVLRRSQLRGNEDMPWCNKPTAASAVHIPSINCAGMQQLLTSTSRPENMQRGSKPSTRHIIIPDKTVFITPTWGLRGLGTYYWATVSPVDVFVSPYTSSRLSKQRVTLDGSFNYRLRCGSRREALRKIA